MQFSQNMVGQDARGSRPNFVGNAVNDTGLAAHHGIEPTLGDVGRIGFPVIVRHLGIQHPRPHEKTGVRGTRQQAGYGNSAILEFVAKGRGERIQESLGAVIYRLVCAGHQSGDGPGDENAPLLAFPHRRGYPMYEMQCAIDVGMHDSQNLMDVLIQKSAAQAAAGIGNQHIDGATHPIGRVEQQLDSFQRRQIALHRRDRYTICRELGGNVVNLGLVGGDEQIKSGLRAQPRKFQPNSAGCSGNHGNPVRSSAHTVIKAHARHFSKRFPAYFVPEFAYAGARAHRRRHAPPGLQYSLNIDRSTISSSNWRFAQPMAHRSLWRGAISFGLIYVPVEMYAAARDGSLHLHLLDSRDFAPVGYERVNKKTGKVVDWSDVVKGYEYAKDNYVALSDADFKQANVKASETISISSFCDAADISPIYYETPYFLAPGKGGQKVYALLRETLHSSRKVAVATFVMRGRQHLCLVAPHGRALMLLTLRFAEELLSPENLALPAASTKTEKLSAAELNMARKLVDEMTSDWKPAAFKDTYRADLMRRIQEKIKKKQTRVLVAEESIQDERPKAQVIDLMDALRKSLKAGKSAQPRGPARPSVRASTAK
jgi:DNA end-binding protein Ku